MQLLFLLVVGLFLAACDEVGDTKRDAVAKEKAKKESEERSARHRAEREAEVKLINDTPSTLSTRLNEWVRVRDGMLVFRGAWRIARRPAPEKFEPWHAMPVSTPWYVKCDDSGISLTLGPWLEMRSSPNDSASSEALFGIELTDARLSNDQCVDLVAVVGRDMQRISLGK